MKIPEEMKLDSNIVVVFKRSFMLPKELGAMKCNAIVQQDDGTLMFFDTNYMKVSGKVRVAYKDIDLGFSE